RFTPVRQSAAARLPLLASLRQPTPVTAHERPLQHDALRHGERLQGIQDRGAALPRPPAERLHDRAGDHGQGLQAEAADLRAADRVLRPDLRRRQEDHVARRVPGRPGPRRRADAGVSEAAAVVFQAEQGETLRRMEQASNYNRWLLARATPYLGRRVLDVGAGIGTFTEQVADGRFVVALEPDPAFVPALRSRFARRTNVEVAAVPLDELAASSAEAFDSIVCFNVLEHIADDAGALARLFGLLEPGGVLLALVPAHPFAYGSIDAMLGHERR